MTREVDCIIGVNRAANTGCYPGYTTNGKHASDSYHERYGTPSPTGDVGLAVDFDAYNIESKMMACAKVFLKLAPKLYELFHTPLGVSEALPT